MLENDSYVKTIILIEEKINLSIYKDSMTSVACMVNFGSLFQARKTNCLCFLKSGVYVDERAPSHKLSIWQNFPPHASSFAIFFPAIIGGGGVVKLLVV